MKFPAYPNYISTGVEWLSEIPVHWELIRLRFLLLDGAEGIKIGPFGSQLTSDMLVEIGYKVYGQENVIAGDFDKGQRYITDKKFSEMSVYEISPNDLLVTMMGTAGRCKVVPEAISAGVMDSHLLRMRFGRKADPKFVELLIDKSIYVSHQVRLNGKGSIMHGLNSSIIKELLVALPSADEQASILSFLDHETARIDALIEEQQRLIELLKEKRQAVISHAVTKGLDPTVPMKDSGVEWLGKVPAHWDVGALKHFISPVPGAIKTGPFGSHLKSEDMKEGPYKVFNQRSVIDADFSAGDNFISEEKFAELRGFTAFPGDVLVTTRGTIGRAAILPDNAEVGILHPCLLRVQVDESKITSSYLCRLIQESHLLKTQLSLMSNSTTIEVIYSETMANLLIPVPPITEQAQIAAFLDDVISKFGALTSDANESVRLLQERRSALISAAVTGKIDVRGWQPPASTQAPELAVAEAH